MRTALSQQDPEKDTGKKKKKMVLVDQYEYPRTLMSLIG
jgi:hypothetical protein